jgi:hypothetical protein
MTKEHQLDIWPPIRLVTMGVVCIAGLIFLPNEWWGIAIKVGLAIWLIGTVVGSFGDLWHEYETMGAFVSIQLAAFAAIMLFPQTTVVTFFAILVIFVGWSTMFSRIKRSAKKHKK